MRQSTQALVGSSMLAAFGLWMFVRNRDSGESGDAIDAGKSAVTSALEDTSIAIRSVVSEWPYPRGSEYSALFEAANTRYNMPHGLLAAQAWQESRFREDIISGRVVSAAGAKGIMQIVPKWHPGVDPLNVPASITYAAAYDAALKKQFGTWELALAAYNWGPGNLSKHVSNREVWPPETLAYVTQISGRISA